jgi:hypothetical protein
MTTSIVSKEEIQPVFNYGSVTKEHKEAVQEVISILEDRTTLGMDISMIVAELKQKFNIEEVPIFDVKKSKWYNYTRDERIGASIQGWRLDKDENGNSIRVPFIGMGADLDYLDEMLDRIIKKHEESKNI